MRWAKSKTTFPAATPDSNAPGAVEKNELSTLRQRRNPEAIEARANAGQPTILPALHSFTPIMNATSGSGRLASYTETIRSAVLAGLREARLGEIRNNQPYAMDGIDFTIPFHADAKGLDYLDDCQRTCADLLSGAPKILASLRHAARESPL
jgi:hypothetical protein